MEVGKINIVNPGSEDYHMHTFTFSDGANTIDEIVRFAGEIGLSKIVITDHSQVYMEQKGYHKKTSPSIMGRWKNVWNDVDVSFGVEADLLNEQGDVCMNIQGREFEHVVLSAHRTSYSGNPELITRGYLNAISRFGDKITLLGHPCANYFDEYVEIEPIVKAANDCGVGLEFNCGNLVIGKTNLVKLDKMFELADRVYVNSDAHVLYDLKMFRQKGFEYLEEKGLYVVE
ncbi:PHP domain-containing protein [Candidatus Woesearchaeota archaeon]|jgi:DNA polymerase (family X)|nr:PHP domain-containing protein [Candidatus Woesearchaeota archaeon]MBT6520276.1 PHP domain-containing protein [Candidatus Woesearchaeota archaeon]MBT7367296.1 PHP domain-containing protein [Candidatus Woesearchaeota archaeon]